MFFPIKLGVWHNDETICWIDTATISVKTRGYETYGITKKFTNYLKWAMYKVYDHTAAESQIVWLRLTAKSKN